MEIIIFYDSAGKHTIEIMVIVKRALVSKQEIAAYDRAADPRHREHAALYPKEAHHAPAEGGAVADLQYIQLDGAAVQDYQGAFLASGGQENYELFWDYLCDFDGPSRKRQSRSRK